jgi:GMP synthase (glutamine-hydrolysing)
MLLIIDNQSSFIKKFKRNFLSEQNIDFRFFDHNEPLVFKPEETVDGIILSGGKGSPYEPLNLTADFVALMNYDVPIFAWDLKS